MPQRLHSLTRMATAAVLAFTMGCGAAEETNTAEAGAPVGTISQELNTAAFTIADWPDEFPLTVGAPLKTVLILVSSGSNIQMNVGVDASGNVTIMGFKYAAYAATSPNYTFVKSTTSRSNTFMSNGAVGYNIVVKMEWTSPGITISISANVVPGGSIKSGSTTLCSDV